MRVCVCKRAHERVFLYVCVLCVVCGVCVCVHMGVSFCVLYVCTCVRDFCPSRWGSYIAATTAAAAAAAFDVDEDDEDEEDEDEEEDFFLRTMSLMLRLTFSLRGGGTDCRQKRLNASSSRSASSISPSSRSMSFGVKTLSGKNKTTRQGWNRYLSLLDDREREERSYMCTQLFLFSISNECAFLGGITIFYFTVLILTLRSYLYSTFY